MSAISQNPDLFRLYNNARAHGAHEHAAATFFNHLFQNYIFQGKYWFIDTQIPPSDLAPHRKVDMAVKYFENGSWNPVVLCFAEIKRDNAPPSEIDNVEEQAFHACESYCHRETAPFVYAMTTIGPLARFFQYRYGNDHFDALLPGDPPADASRRYYIDPASDAGWGYWLRAFETMKQLPPKVPVEGQTAPTTYLGSLIGGSAAGSTAGPVARPVAQQISPSLQEMAIFHNPRPDCITFSIPHGRSFYMRPGWFRFEGNYYSWNGQRLDQVQDRPPEDVEILFVPERERFILVSALNNWKKIEK